MGQPGIVVSQITKEMIDHTAALEEEEKEE